VPDQDTMTPPPEPARLLPVILTFLDAGRPFAVATVIEASGSTPVPAGAKAVIEADGTIHGTVGGGAVEAQAQHHARQALGEGTPRRFTFDLAGAGPDAPDPICGGRMRLLVDPTAPRFGADYRSAAEALARRERGVWITTIREPDPRQTTCRFVAATAFDSPGGFPAPDALARALAETRPVLVLCPGDAAATAFVEPLIPPPVLLVVGGGHVGQAVATQAAFLGLDVAVIEDRPDFAEPRRFPAGTRVRCGAVADEVAAFPTGPDTYIVLVTRGHQHDAAALRACVRRPSAYLGMIGSRRKVPLLRRQFLEAGWATAEEFDRVHAPIGLDIGAVTVPEIATSILAQIIAVRRRGAAPRIPPT
jgi:xanthine dehydrogenase accessory factor